MQIEIYTIIEKIHMFISWKYFHSVCNHIINFSPYFANGRKSWKDRKRLGINTGNVEIREFL